MQRSNRLRALRYPGFWLTIGFALVGLVIYASLTPSPEQLPAHFWDKAEHACAYLVLAFWFSCIYTRRHHLLVGVVLLVMGIALEFIQPHFGRDFQISDMLADAVGILCGLILGLTRLAAVFSWLENRLGGWAA